MVSPDIPSPLIVHLKPSYLPCAQVARNHFTRVYNQARNRFSDVIHVHPRGRCVDNDPTRITDLAA
jgi:hypothetical protein